MRGVDAVAISAQTSVQECEKVRRPICSPPLDQTCYRSKSIHMILPSDYHPQSTPFFLILD
eukprot:1287-Eustigmatos_ZCMA.PRE.1